jgi:hypothetical protein
LASGILGFSDFWPDANKQRIIAVERDGRVQKFKYPYSSSEVLPASANEPTLINSPLFVTFSQCGAEETGRDKKIIIFTGKHKPQVISADGSTRSNMSNPAADWTGNNQPFFSIIHRGRPYTFGNDNDKHRIYVGSATDHEDYTTSPLTFSVYPGQGEAIIHAFIFKKKLFAVKKPLGLYILDDTDSSTNNWRFVEFNMSFGAASPFSGMAVLDDFLLANNYGGLTSLAAVNDVEDYKTADFFYNMGMEEAINQEMSLRGGNERHTLYYPHKKMGFITYQSSAKNQNDRIVQLSVLKKGVEATIITKDQPNCLGLIRDFQGVQRPCYGAEDGFIYEMDQVDRNVDGNSYRGEIFTPHMDFGEGDPVKAELMKAFDFLEIVYEPTGNWNMNYEVFVDGLVGATGTFKLDGRSDLGEIITGTGKTDSLCPMSKKFPIGGQGRRIMVRLYNETTSQNFKLVRLNIYFKYTNHHQVVG